MFWRLPDEELSRSKHVAIKILYKNVFDGHLFNHSLLFTYERLGHPCAHFSSVFPIKYCNIFSHLHVHTTSNNRWSTEQTMNLSDT